MLPPPLEISTNRQNHNPHKPPAQPCPSPQCSLHHTYCTLERLNLTLQWPITCPRAGQPHTGRALCAVVTECCLLLWKFPQTGKPHPQRTTCTAPPLPQLPVQAPQLLLHAAEAAFDLAVPHGMPRAGHSPQDVALLEKNGSNISKYISYFVISSSFERSGIRHAVFSTGSWSSNSFK